MLSQFDKMKRYLCQGSAGKNSRCNIRAEETWRSPKLEHRRSQVEARCCQACCHSVAGLG